MPILIRNCAYLIRDPQHVERDCDLWVEGRRITTIAKNLPLPPGAEVLDGSRCAVIPGLINPHTHLYQNFLKGVAPGLPLVPWCNQVLFPTVGALRGAITSRSSRVPYLWSAVAAAEMIKGGVTCCINMDVVYPGVMRAWEDAGFRGVMAYTLSNRWVPAELRSEEEVMRRKVLSFVEEFHHPDGLTTVFMAPSTLFLCTEDFSRWAGEQARRLDLGVQIHIAETASEVDDLLKETGRRPVEELEHLGLLDERLSAVHCCHLDPHEIDLLAGTRTCAVHCPKSNMKLADGIMPVTALQAAGVPVSVATDGCASNDLLDMWEEMRAALLLARVSQGDAGALQPQEAFAMATIHAARAARVDAGELNPGKLADLAVVELKSPSLRPFHDEDIFNMLVFCAKASDVRDVVINGKIVMRDRHLTTIDEDSLLEEAESIEAPIFNRRPDYSFGQ